MSSNDPLFVGVKKKGKIRETIESLLVALVIAFFIRSFAIEAFKIPSGSMKPTLMIGDHIFVNKFIYGLRIPFTKKRIVNFRSPDRGEPIVFIYPVDEGKDFIKRVVGLPGDQIRLQGDEIFVNGTPIVRHPLKIESGQKEDTVLIKIVPNAVAAEVGIRTIPYTPDWQSYSYYSESQGPSRYIVQFDPELSHANDDFVVPPHHLFVMGDNRDNSSDSRDWGFVPTENVKGKAMFVWLSIDSDRKTLRWDRFGKWIH
ncbi:MAG: signal peptidase I [Deltaproteobacteria bacterium]|nr:signal peptidase I [Deltaproteobacteria bacterium]